MARSNETKIVLLGKTGVGKSSLGNAILGDSLFKEKSSPTSETNMFNAESKDINGERVTVIDTPGIFDNRLKEEDLKAEMIKCIEHCSPCIHAFLIVLKVDRYTDQEKEIIHKIKQYFPKEILKHAVVVFTHGDQLLEGQTIDEFVKKSKDLTELVGMCGGKCHVVDNKYWKNQQDGYRSNRFQVKQLLKTIETMKDDKGVYTNELLQLVGKKKLWKILKISAKITIGALLGILLGAVVLVPCVGLDAAIGSGVGILSGVEAAVGARNKYMVSI
ncbi:GTPase IMAP family member 9-like [Fundulus heteroclitus]|uniref:GTPase IMAP family member 9-like n=1 Tax=Fundulus heteroclitus TaxID=8078 RepID=UPI00165A7C3E|nr:GTPase IMAP family member 9-like [Fundulus heteroclitus]